MFALRSLKNRIRRAFALLCVSMPLAAALFLGSCSDGDLFSPNRNSKNAAQLGLRTYYGSVNASQNAADINRIRLTIKVLPDGPTLTPVVVEVNPTDAGWNLPVEVPANSALSVLVELLNVTGGVETVLFSGMLPVIQVTSGPQPPAPPIAVYPGPPGNLSITAISISPRDQQLLEGSQITLNANVVGGGGTPVVVWSSSDPTVAAVDANGVLRTLLPGSATITATAGRAADAITVTVGARAAGIVIEPAAPTAISHHQEVVLTGSVVDARNQPISGLTVEWSVADATVATHVGNGVIRALRNGTTLITATGRQGSRVFTGSTTFTVLQQAASMSISPTSTAFAAAGATQQFTVTAVDANGHRVESNAISWESTDPAVATVNDNGLVTAVGDGTTVIRARSGSVSAEATVKVARPAVIEISPEQETLTYIGATQQMSAVVRDGAGNAMDLRVIWYSLHPAVASVDDNGLVTATGDGTATIVAEVPTLRAQATIEVNRLVTQIIFDRGAFTLNAGQTQQVLAWAADESGEPIDDQPIAWSVANGAIASVSSTGLVRGLSEGTTEIIAQVGAHEARLAVQVIGTLASTGVEIVPAAVRGVGNCFPFGGNTNYRFTGFIYRNIPAFSMQPGDKIAFDLGAQNSQEARRNIFFAIANKNPELGTPGVSQDVRATAWQKVVDESQVPLNPHGNTEIGDYELVYTAEAAFSFPGGGFIIGFQASPPASYSDAGCEQVLAFTNYDDASNKFYRRFLQLPDLHTGALDMDNSLGQSTWIGGVKIYHAAVSSSSRPTTVLSPVFRRPAATEQGTANPDGTLAKPVPAAPSAKPESQIHR